MPTEAMTMPQFIGRFWANMTKPKRGCWVWTQGLTSTGYGQMSSGRRFIGESKASRIAWVLTHGQIPEGLEVLHCCDNRPCSRPSHLFLGTQLDNVKDAFEKGRR